MFQHPIKHFLTAIFTLQRRRASSREHNASPLTRLWRPIAASTFERQLQQVSIRRGPQGS